MIKLPQPSAFQMQPVFQRVQPFMLLSSEAQSMPTRPPQPLPQLAIFLPLRLCRFP